MEIKRVFNSKLKPLFTVFFNSINLSEYRIGIKIDKDPLAAEQKNYLSKIVNVYTVYDLDVWPKNTTNNFKFKNFLFGATNVYSGYGITFASAGSWSFNNDLARSIIIFGVNNSSLSHSDNCKNNFSILDEGLTFEIVDALITR